MSFKKAIWLAYDLGLKGDYTGLFAWLDNHDAIECGNGLAFFRIDWDKNKIKQGRIEYIVFSDIVKSISLSKTDRLYMIWKDDSTNKMRGTFLSGSRKQNPWQGYGKQPETKTFDSEE
jgi:hypothetical protein